MAGTAGEEWRWRKGRPQKKTGQKTEKIQKPEKKTVLAAQNKKTTDVPTLSEAGEEEKHMAEKTPTDAGNSAPRVSENPFLSFVRRHRGDLLLITALLAVAAVALLLLRACSAPGGVAVVTVDGREVGRYDLSRDAAYPIAGWNGGSNLLVIEGGAARMAEASCPDKLCEHTGRIFRTGERIVCLPNRVVVEIRAADPAPDFSLGMAFPALPASSVPAAPRAYSFPVCRFFAPPPAYQGGIPYEK